MPFNPKMSAVVAGYVDPSLKRRAQRITKRKPRYTMSRIIEECMKIALPEVEKQIAQDELGS